MSNTDPTKNCYDNNRSTMFKIHKLDKGTCTMYINSGDIMVLDKRDMVLHNAKITWRKAIRTQYKNMKTSYDGTQNALCKESLQCW